MFVSKSKYNKLVCDYQDLKFMNDIARKDHDKLYNRLLKEKSECSHKYGKWKQIKIEEKVGGYIITVDGQHCFKDKQVRKCKKCGFMESKDI